MKMVRFSVPPYKVNVALIQVEGAADEERAKECCEEMGLGDKDTSAVLNAIKSGGHDYGDTFHDFMHRQILVVFYRMTSSRTNAYGHEKRHVEDRILQWCGIDDMESAAYLAGFLSEYFDDLRFK